MMEVVSSALVVLIICLSVVFIPLMIADLLIDRAVGIRSAAEHAKQDADKI